MSNGFISVRRFREAIILLLGCAMIGAAAAAETPDKVIALKAARLFDGKSKALAPNGVIIVQGRTIIDAGSGLQIPQGAQVIDATDCCRLIEAARLRKSLAHWPGIACNAVVRNSQMNLPHLSPDAVAVDKPRPLKQL